MHEEKYNYHDRSAGLIVLGLHGLLVSGSVQLCLATQQSISSFH